MVSGSDKENVATPATAFTLEVCVMKPLGPATVSVTDALELVTIAAVESSTSTVTTPRLAPFTIGDDGGGANTS